MARITFSLILGWAVLMAGNVQAMPMPEIVTLGAADDGFGTSGTNGDDVQSNGTGAVLLIRNAGSNYARKAWIRFDLSSYDVNLNVPATLQLHRDPAAPGAAGSNTTRVFGLNAGFVPSSGVLDTNWSESALTWNNGPGNNAASGSSLNTSDTTLIDSFTYIPTGGSGEGFDYYTLSVGSLAPYLQPDGSLTLILTGPVSGSAYMYFAPKEAGSQFAPQLTFNAILPAPEPGTGLMLGLGSFACLVFRQRRRSRHNPERERADLV